jgi:hypothetical protein
MPSRITTDPTAAAPNGGNPRGKAKTVLTAGQELRSALGDHASIDGHLTIMLFILAHDEGAGVTTAACCVAADAPRTTALRWIKALVDQGLVLQREDAADRRITMLSLSVKASQAVERWLLALAHR